MGHKRTLRTVKMEEAIRRFRVKFPAFKVVKVRLKQEYVVQGLPGYLLDSERHTLDELSALARRKGVIAGQERIAARRNKVSDADKAKREHEKRQRDHEKAKREHEKRRREHEKWLKKIKRLGNRS